ncbi:SCO3242 family prenyltransferase [Cellulomonas fimi]|uniref:SCO3242 family prenyltransferase n=1 Tax=Cellulomonas sp. RIT-PI-Y TaxID=3035297 RepID=UPI0021DA9977
MTVLVRGFGVPGHRGTPTVADHLELVRAPAVLTVLGDALAGSAAAGHPWTLRRAALPLASACLYSGGMALNDWADRELDAVERPERPIPSGRITPRRAVAVAGGLGVAGLGCAAVGGGVRALAVAAPLAVGVWLYDAVLKESPAGPVAMAACRGLDVLMGAGVGRLRAAAPAALTVAGHTAGVTWLSRGEVHGTSAVVAASVLAGSAAVLAATALPRPTTAGTPRLRITPPTVARRRVRYSRSQFGPRATELGADVPTSRAGAGALGRLATLGGAAAYAASVLGPQLAAVREPGAARARTATGAGIRAMIPLQVAWAARSGSPAAAGVIGLAGLVGIALRRRGRTVSET